MWVSSRPGASAPRSRAHICKATYSPSQTQKHTAEENLETLKAYFVTLTCSATHRATTMSMRVLSTRNCSEAEESPNSVPPYRSLRPEVGRRMCSTHLYSCSTVKGLLNVHERKTECTSERPKRRHCRRKNCSVLTALHTSALDARDSQPANTVGGQLRDHLL